jgi:alkaline phosphatase D
MDRRFFERLLTHPTSRRRFLGAGITATTAALSYRGAPTRAAGGGRASRIVTRPQFAANPFALGVASGDPLPDGIVLWTRLAPDPANGGGMTPETVEVRWEIAADDTFADIVQSGTELATPELAHSVHVDVSGLEPGREYAYRFTTGDEVSPVGRTKTAPAANAPLDRLRFAAVSCAHYEHGFFTAYRHLAQEEVDFAVCLGDYIYEYGPKSEYENAAGGPVRNVTGGETMTLDDYRNRHALYKSDADLQAAHAAFPWIVTWDDHEVDNDYAGSASENGDPVEAFLARRAAAYQAYYEHMPLRPESLPHGPDARIYRRLSFGDLAELNLLDTRQYRSDQACGGVAPRCDASLDPAVTLTGPEQEAWLFDGLAGSNARWNVIAQQVMMAQLDGDLSPDEQLFNHDQWDGYPLARQRLLDHLQASGVINPIVLTGDVHSSWVADLKLNFDDETSPTVGTEFVTTSVTSFNPLGNRLRFLLPSNPHFSFFDLAHGYTRHEITPDLWRADYRAIPSVNEPEQPIDTTASFVVENGKPGAVSG